MTQIDLISNDWSDLLFENRNKKYGAYVLRLETGRRNVISILGVLAFVGTVFGIINAIDYYEKYVVKPEFTDVIEVSTLHEKKPEAKVIRNKPVEEKPDMKKVEAIKGSIKFTAPVIKQDNLVNEKDEMRSMDELNSSMTAIGFADVIGNDDNAAILHAQEVINTEPVVKHREEEEKTFTTVEQMPTFPGGDGALMSYLARNIRYPSVAEENGIQGRVVIQFVVGKDGSISGASVIKGIDPSLDKEALRVINSMPKWIPGRQNGSNVKVRFTLPVTFRLN